LTSKILLLPSFKWQLPNNLKRRKKEEGRRKKEEGRRKKEEGRRKKEGGRRNEPQRHRGTKAQRKKERRRLIIDN
jgi:hypothetical protein